MSTTAPHTIRVRRFAAAFLDVAIAMTFALVPAALTQGPAQGRVFGVGLLVGTAYLLLRDGIPYAEWGARSLAKRWLGIRPYPVSGEAMTWRHSFRRNLTVAASFGIPALIYLIGGHKGIPFGDWVIYATLVVLLFEAALVGIDPIGRRIGDRFAQTRILEARH
jgi:hypothetical protein